MRKALIVAAALLVPGMAHAAAFTNGSFEEGLDPGSFRQIETGAGDITGWTVSGGNVDYIGNYWEAGQGSRSIDLSGNTFGTLSQTFDTVAGQAYTVNYLLAGNPVLGPTVKHMSVSATGNATAFETFDTAHTNTVNMGWTQKSYSFTAAGNSTTLSFSDLNGSGYGAALDGVSVVAAVPEPATWALMIGGFGLVGGTMRRRRGAGKLATA